MREINILVKVLLLFIIFMAGCMSRELVRIDPKTESYVTTEFQAQEFVGVDILVVVDNSGSMAQEQELLRAAFPRLISAILNPPYTQCANYDPANPECAISNCTDEDADGWYSLRADAPANCQRVHAPVRDLHIGVVSTDLGVGGYPGIRSCEENPAVGDDGILQHTPHGANCESSYPAFLSYSISETQEPNRDQVMGLARDFGCIAVLGTGGCGFEQQLEAARRALIEQSASGGPNSGFLRDDTILTVLIVSDEEDCSASDTTIFDTSAISYDINLVCYYQKDKLHNVVNRYKDAFIGEGGLRPKENTFVMGFIVGVPPDVPQCNGRGSELAGCLESDPMQERVRGDGKLLEYSCIYPPGCTPGTGGNCSSEAFPARRYVELAQALGDNAIVQSICTESFVPAVEALTEKLREAIRGVTFQRQLQVSEAEGDRCRCVANCEIIETLSDNRECTREGDDPNVKEKIAVVIDPETHIERTVCRIRQAGARITNCESVTGCNDPRAVYEWDASVGAGWWYDHTENTVHFEGVIAEPNSDVDIQCSSVVCPEMRQCGDVCCDINEYCYQDVENNLYCMFREDVCKEYGDDLWCPGAGPAGLDVCCLDPDLDGELDWVRDETTGMPVLPKVTRYHCVGDKCQSR